MTHARSPGRADLYTDVARMVRAEVWHRDSTEMYRRHRHDWPDLWLAIDDLVTLLDGEDPPAALPGSCSCGCCP
jgi:hypothetical protein